MEEELNIIPANALPNASESDIENGNIIIVNSDGDVKKADALAMKGRKGDKGDTGLVNANFKTLDKIEYIIDASTNAVLSTTTVTDFGLRESPWTLDYYNAGDIETFDVATNRVYPSTGQYVRAFMYYV